MSEKILCGPCGYAENNKNAEKWCTVCEEGLCVDCEKVHKSIKTSRNHRLISTADFRQIQNITISFNCKDHDKRLELYCKTHDVAICLGCVPSRHRTCSDVIPLDKAAENVKQSTALADLEDTLTGSLRNIEQIIIDRESAFKDFESQKQTIKKSIIDTRARILKKLENLELKLLQELDTKHEFSKSEASKFINRIKNSKRDFNCLREQTTQLKSFASDIQLFLGTRQINEAAFKEVNSIKDGIKSVPNFEVNLQLNPSIIALINEVVQLGKITVKKTTTSLPFKEVKVDQAQIQLRVQDTKSIKSIRLRLKKSLSVKHEAQPTGCSILSNGNLLISDHYGLKGLMEYSEDGKHILDMLYPEAPFDLTVIDADRIAVTYQLPFVDILDIKKGPIKKRFNLKSNCYGISYQDNKLFIVIEDGIVITDIAGKILNTLRIDCGSYIGTTKDRIYFTSEIDDTVHCISMAGDKIWIRKEESLSYPLGIALDDHQNVFVVDNFSKSLIVIQHDGTSSRTLLSTTDGLDNPRALHFNNERKVLLLCDDKVCSLYTFE